VDAPLPARERLLAAPRSPERPQGAFDALNPPEVRAVKWFVQRVLDEIPARLMEAALFGSKARGDARPSSDLDVLLVFQHLPPSREPHASAAERIADEIAVATGVPLTVWSVSLRDLEEGSRTPMLVDALYDALPIWCADRPVPRVPFTPADALWCTRSLLDRVAEGSDEFARYLGAGDWSAAATRARDDLVRLCTALELRRGVTRPRRGELMDRAVRRCARGRAGSRPGLSEALAWARNSFGTDGKDDKKVVSPPPLSATALARLIADLQNLVHQRAQRLRVSLTAGTSTP
jgi:hypothetical protein